MRKELTFDCLILGGGPAGLSAGIYCARGALKTAVIDISMMGGTPTNYLEIENYPGFANITGFDLATKLEQHLDKFGVEKFEMQEITSISLLNPVKTVETNDVVYKAKTVIVATGAVARKLGVEGEKEFTGRGVSYCAVCDGAFYKDKIVVVVGGGNAAVEEGMYLTRFANKVYIVHRRNELRADKIVQERAFKNDKIEFVFDSVVTGIYGSDCVQKIKIKNVKTNEVSEITAQGVFPYIGFVPNTDLINSQVAQDANGFIITDEYMATNIDGVYAVGDVRTTPLRQVITACSDGAIGATSAIKFLDEVKAKAVI